ncbi:hypothetical protein DYB25_010997, partial [Aphanomyces astaci]
MMAKKRKRANATGVIAAWETFWDAMEDAAAEAPDTDHRISIFKAETREDDFIAVERALSLQPPDATLRDLEMLLADPLELQSMLTSFSEKDSFMRILLRHESIQTPLLNLLLEHLSEFAQKAVDETGTIVGGLMPSSGICSLILRHIRWMECVYEPSALTEHLLTTLNTYPMFLQKDILHILPELVADNDFQVRPTYRYTCLMSTSFESCLSQIHAHLAVDTLLETISSENELVVPAIEALSNFHMPVDISDDVTRCILGRLTSSSLQDMPGLVRFLVQTATDANAVETIDAIRDKVSECILQTAAASNDEAFLLQQFVHGLGFRSDLLACFFKLVATSTAASLLDVWTLVGLHSSQSGPGKAKAAAVFVKNVANGVFTKEVLHGALAAHLGGLTPYLNSVVHLAGAALQAPDAVAMGQFMLTIVFNQLATARDDHVYEYQIQIVSDLVDFAMSSGGESTVDGALDTLLALSSHERHSLDKFLSLLKHLLDCIERFSVDQCRRVYQLLFGVGGSTDPDLCITVRKQLYHQDNLYRTRGMLGYICCLEADLYDENNIINSMDGLDESEGGNPDQLEKRMRDRLDILRDACRKQANALSFMYAELNHLVHRMGRRGHRTSHMLAILDEKYSDVLMQEFLPGFDARSHQQGAYKRHVFNHTFRCDQKSAISELGDMPTDAQDGAFLALWHAVNWCRDLLNCFSSDAALASKVLTRLENAVEFESILYDAIANCPTSVWLPPGSDMSTNQLKKPSFKPPQLKKAKAAAVAPIGPRLHVIRASFTRVHPQVIGILPTSKDSIDPPSLLFLVDQFLSMLRTSLVKSTTITPATQLKAPRSKLVHSGVYAPGFAVFDEHLKFHLLNVANNVRWVLHAPQLPRHSTLYALVTKYFECIVVIAKAQSLFEQQKQQLMQLVALQQLILPTLTAMSDALVHMQSTLTCLDITLARHVLTALVALERLKIQWNDLHVKALLFSAPRDPAPPVAALALSYLRRDWAHDQPSTSDPSKLKSADLD